MVYLESSPFSQACRPWCVVTECRGTARSAPASPARLLRVTCTRDSALGSLVRADTRPLPTARVAVRGLGGTGRSNSYSLRVEGDDKGYGDPEFITRGVLSGVEVDLGWGLGPGRERGLGGTPVPGDTDRPFCPFGGRFCLYRWIGFSFNKLHLFSLFL